MGHIPRRPWPKDGSHTAGRSIRSVTKILGAPSCSRTFRDLRHTYGTTLAESGVHERVAQQLLAHAGSRTTREIYTRLSERMMDQAVQAISDAVDRVVGDASGSRSGSQTSPRAGRRKR